MSLRAGILLFALLSAATAEKFYDDDPLVREPAPVSVQKANPRKLSDWYDLFLHEFGHPGDRRKVPAGDVNTLGEVLEGAWYEKRHARRRMSLAELATGPGGSNPPADGPWLVISAKSEGITPGFMIEDRLKRRYFIKFDPIRYPELATAADVIVSKLFYALGYHVPENYIVRFEPSRVQVRQGVTFRDERGLRRPLTSRHVTELLLRTPRDADGRHRASASYLIPGRALHEFRYFGTRADDPNDIVPHEHRRMLRGLHVFCAWVNHDDSRAINTHDTLVENGGKQYIRHYLLDFGSTLGSASSGPNSPRGGFEELFAWSSSAKEFFSFGFYVPHWARIHYPSNRSIGRFSADSFEPEKWTPEYPNPAFENRLPEDVFWAAEQVAAFTDNDIRALVRTGQYSDPATEEYVSRTLIARRDAIARAYLRHPMSLTGFRIEGGAITFRNLAVDLGLTKQAPAYEFRWFELNNETGSRTALPDSTASIPRSNAQYLGVEMRNQSRAATIYMRQAKNGLKIVGIDRAF